MIDPRDLWNRSGAQWISHQGAQDLTNLYLQFARGFECCPPRPLTLHITAVSHYVVAINGVAIGRGPAVGHQGLYYYHHYDIPAGILREGRNTITVLLFHDGAATETIPQWRYGDPGLLAWLHGDGVSVPTDDTWHVRIAPTYCSLAGLTSRWIGYKEIYHGERDDAWRSPDYDHAGWPHAIAVAPPESPDFVSALVPLSVPELRARVAPPCRCVELSANLGRIELRGLSDDGSCEVTASAGEPFAAPSATFDFERIVVGYPEIAVTGGPCSFEVWYGETLDLYRLDAVHLPPDGTWRAYQRRAFRFLMIKFLVMEGEVTVTRLCQHTAEYPFSEAGRLEVPEPRLNRIVEVSLDTLRANTSYHYEDCPIREQALWVLDMRIMGLVNAYLCGNHELTAKCIRQGFAVQREDGAIPGTGPKVNMLYFHDFMLHLVACLAEHHRHTGDAGIVRDLYPSALKLHRYIDTWRASDGLIDTDLVDVAPGASVFADWNEQVAKHGKTTFMNALYVLYLEDMAELAQVCGRAGEADAYRRDADAVREAIRRLLFRPDKGVFLDGWRKGEFSDVVSQQANLAAILADVAPRDRVGDILEHALNDAACVRPGSASTYWVVFAALAKVGRVDIIESTIRAYWGGMLDRGATTWWEVFTPNTPAATYPHPFLGHCPLPEHDWIPVSCCHAWSSVPGYAIPRYLLGVDLSQVWRGRVAVSADGPRAFDGTRYRLPLADGMLELEFARRNGKREVRVVEKPDSIDVIVA